MLDSSGSLRNDYHKEKDFIKKIAGQFNIGSDGSRTGVVTFSSEAVHSIKLKDHSDVNSFNAAVDEIPLMGQETRIDKALRLAQKEFFAPENGGRANLPKVLILLTDGTQTKKDNAEDPSIIADEMRKAGIDIIVVGIGSDIDKEELDSMAGGMDSAVNPETFEKLVSKEFIDKLTKRTCRKG